MRRTQKASPARATGTCFPKPRRRDWCPPAPRPASSAHSPGVIGTLQAMEVIKLITGAGEPLIGRLLLYDGLAASFQTVRYGRKS
jgi:hypothetical protein